MDLFKSLDGMVELNLTSADPAGAMRAINAAGITIYHVRQEGELTLHFSLRRRDYRSLRQIVKRRGETLCLARRGGVYWTFRRGLGRPVLWLGILILLALTVFLPRRIFFIQVEGNQHIPQRLILEKAASCGIEFGASRRQVRSEQMKNALLEAIPDLQWAGINTQGCLATISVRERSQPKETLPLPQVSSIIASRDGVICELTIKSGNPLCKVGQAVTAGQVLVSGYTDCGICIRATRSEGEIVALTQRQLTVVTPANYVRRSDNGLSQKKISLIIGKKRINFFKGSGISDSSCVKMYQEYQLTLPGGFCLPVSVAIEQLQQSDTCEVQQTEDTATVVMERFAEDYLSSVMIAGTIQNAQHRLYSDEGVFLQKGSYACMEMIGITRIEEILDNYETYGTDRKRGTG